jgi:hypothetical protein
MLRQYCFWLLIFCTITITAQNNFTFINDNYSGINSAILSPTQPYLNPNPWDSNLISTDVFFQNNYAYISQQSILGLLNTSIKATSPKRGISGENQPNVLDFYNKDNANFLFNSDILGPSFSLSANINDKKYVFGLFSRLRTQASVLDFDNYLRFSNKMISTSFV